MARQIVVSFEGAESSFEMKKVQRADLYGARRRVALDPSGEPCTRARLSEDGATLIVSGMTGQAFFDQAGVAVPRDLLVALDSEGKALPVHPSTLGVAQAAKEVSASRVADLRVQSVYALDAASLDDALRAALEEGRFFEIAFNYRSDVTMNSAFLLANTAGEFYALTGDLADPLWLEPDARIEFDDDPDEDDDLDFEMF